MSVELWLFFGLALVAVATALAMLLSRNAVYAALFLVLNFATIAVFYLLLGAPFVSLVQVTVYAGAIMVLFLFVVMLLGAERLPEAEQALPPWQRPLAVALALVLLAEVVVLGYQRAQGLGLLGAAPSDFGSPQAIGSLLLSTHLLPFELTSVLLLVAMVGAIVLTARDRAE